MRLPWVGLLLQMVRREVLEIIQAIAKLVDERASEDALLLDVPGPVRGELDDFDLRPPKPLHGVPREEEEARVPGRLVVVDPRREPHPPIDGPFVRFVEEPALHVAEVLPDLRFPQVPDLGVVRPAVVPGHAGRLLDELPEQIAAPFGIDGLGAEAYPVPPRPCTGADVGCAVRFDLAGRRPHHQDEPTCDRFGRQDGLIGRIEPIVLATDPPLRRFDLRRGQAGRGQGSPPVPLPDADDDVAAVQVVVVVRERADRPQHLGAGGMWVPGRLELHPLGLHSAAIEESVEVDGKNRAHG